MSDVPILDTHAWIWWMDQDERLGLETLEALNSLPPNRRPVISDISLWEVATLVTLGRLKLAGGLERWLHHAADPKTVKVCPITPIIALAVAQLPDSFHRDPADRVIVATSRTRGLRLLTHDRRIIDSKLVRIWSSD